MAKIRGDRALLERSRLLELESFLSDRLMAARQGIILENIHHDVVNMLKSTHMVVLSQVETADRELMQLEGLRDDRQGRLRSLMLMVRQQQSAYLARAERFQSSRRHLKKQLARTLEVASVSRIDLIIGSYRTEMRDRWTTRGLRNTMKTLFDRFHEAMADIGRCAEETGQSVRDIYREFDEQLDVKAPYPRPLRLSGFEQELEQLHQEAEAFRTSPVMTLIEQNFLIQRFFVALVSRARDIFYRADRDVRDWGKDVLNPLVKEMWRHKRGMEERMLILREISHSRERLEGRIEELREVRSRHAEQFASLQQIHAEFDRTFSTGPSVTVAAPPPPLRRASA